MVLLRCNSFNLITLCICHTPSLMGRVRRAVIPPYNWMIVKDIMFLRRTLNMVVKKIAKDIHSINWRLFSNVSTEI